MLNKTCVNDRPYGSRLPGCGKKKGQLPADIPYGGVYVSMCEVLV